MTKNKLITNYIEMLNKWSSTINLVQPETLNNVYNRHIEDCIQIEYLLNKSSYILDVGSGAGLPGVILSIIGFENVILCEKNYKKCVFLHDVKANLRLSYQIYNGDIFKYQIPNNLLNKTVLVSRAFGALSTLLDVMSKLNIPRGVFHKGESYLKEIEAAKQKYNFNYETIPSKTNENSVILNVTNVRRK